MLIKEKSADQNLVNQYELSILENTKGGGSKLLFMDIMLYLEG